MLLSKDINRNLSKEERAKLFIKRSRQKFQDLFTYEKTIDSFISSEKPVIITCKKHGDFTVRVNDHIRSKTGGCPVCGYNKKTDNNEKRKAFIKKSINKFGNTFDYSDTNIYGLTDLDEFSIRCKKHDYTFKISAPDHLRSRTGGCPFCAEELLQTEKLHKRQVLYDKYFKSILITHTTDIDKYDYSLIDKSIPVNKKNSIICKKHGIFYQSIAAHANGEGCPICAEEQKEAALATSLKNITVCGKPVISEYIINNNEYLKNKPYDVYIKPLNLLIEVNGDQHYMKKFKMTDTDLILRREIDKNKKMLALSLGYNYLVLRVSKIKQKDKNMLIKDISSSTTIETFEKYISKYSDGVEYTKNVEIEKIINSKNN